MPALEAMTDAQALHDRVTNAIVAWPVEQWTATFGALGARELIDLLEAIETRHPDLYKKYSLAYLHARALVDEDDDDFEDDELYEDDDEF